MALMFWSSRGPPQCFLLDRLRHDPNDDNMMTRWSIDASRCAVRYMSERFSLLVDGLASPSLSLRLPDMSATMRTAEERTDSRGCPAVIVIHVLPLPRN